MPTTNEAVLEHLASIKSAVNTAIDNAQYYRGRSSDMTSSARATTLAKVTTVPSALQHASNCSLCVGWDGSD
jgi:hypothetical protein